MPVADVAEDRTTDDLVALLDAMPDATAVLDLDGTIVAVNHAWRMFSVDNGGDPARTGVGVSYIDVCERAAAAGCPDAVAVRDGLHAVLAGATVESELDYPCPSPTVGRWFNLRITKITGRRAGLLVSHLNISRRKTAEADLERRASHDPLTGLANRAKLAEQLSSALAPRSRLRQAADIGVVVVDLDGFKPVNDTYGHAAGDEVLQNVAARLRSLSRPGDTVARLGGDEFAILAPGMTVAGIAALAERIRERLGEPYVVHGARPDVGASVGTHLATVGETVADALGRADEAMCAAKRARLDRAMATAPR